MKNLWKILFLESKGIMLLKDVLTWTEQHMCSRKPGGTLGDCTERDSTWRLRSDSHRDRSTCSTCHNPYSHMNRYIPFNYHWLLFWDPGGRRQSGAGLPASKVIKYTIRQRQNTLVNWFWPVVAALIRHFWHCQTLRPTSVDVTLTAADHLQAHSFNQETNQPWERHWKFWTGQSSDTPLTHLISPLRSPRCHVRNTSLTFNCAKLTIGCGGLIFLGFKEKKKATEAVAA